jgi:hypothetical protein
MADSLNTHFTVATLLSGRLQKRGFAAKTLLFLLNESPSRLAAEQDANLRRVN